MVVDHRDRERTDRLFHALSDATRREIVGIVLHEEQSVSELARRYPVSFAAIQKHVAVLERAELVTKRRRGREQLVLTNADTLRRAHSLLDGIEGTWRVRIDRIEAVLPKPDEGAQR
jgi:DNA-binding transcriptional ArsR family regulator